MTSDVLWGKGLWSCLTLSYKRNFLYGNFVTEGVRGSRNLSFSVTSFNNSPICILKFYIFSNSKKPNFSLKKIFQQNSFWSFNFWWSSFDKYPFTKLSHFFYKNMRSIHIIFKFLSNKFFCLFNSSFQIIEENRESLAMLCVHSPVCIYVQFNKFSHFYKSHTLSWFITWNGIKYSSYMEHLYERTFEEQQ